MLKPGKKLKRIGAGRRGKRLGLNPARSRDDARRRDDKGRLVAAAAMGRRREIGRVGLDQKAVERDVARDGAQILRLLERHDAGKRDHETEAERGLGEFTRAGEAMEHSAEPPLPHFLRQDRGHVGVGVARVDDERQVELASQRDLPAKDALSHVARRAVIVIVEARLADAYAFRMPGEGAHGVEVLRPLPRRLVRMGADGEEDVVVALGDRGDACGFPDLRADGDHPLDACGAGALNDGVEVISEIGKVEVAVAVDDGHSATASPPGRRWPADRASGRTPVLLDGLWPAG